MDACLLDVPGSLPERLGIVLAPGG